VSGGEGGVNRERTPNVAALPTVVAEACMTPIWQINDVAMWALIMKRRGIRQRYAKLARGIVA